MVLIGSGQYSPALLYDVSNPILPRLLCSISNTSAHLFTGDTFEYLKPVSPNETDVILHSLGSGNESVAGRLPLNSAFGSWLPDLSVMAYTTPGPDTDYGSSTQVWLYSQNRTALLFTYPVGIGDCICRFGLPPQVLAVSPDGQYLVAGWVSGKGSVPLSVYRISDRTRVKTLDQTVMSAFWSRTGHRLFLVHGGAVAAQSWTPEAGISAIAGVGTWSYLPGPSPDGSQVAYTAYADPNNQVNARVYVYDLKAATTRVLVAKLRTQAIFIKDGWVWYLEERDCAPTEGCAGQSQPTGKVYAMNLSAGVEQVVSFAANEDPFTHNGPFQVNFAPGDFWPAT